MSDDRLIMPEVLQQDARDILWRLGQLGEVYLTPGIPHVIQDGEHLLYLWDEQDTVSYFRQGQELGGTNTPRLDLRHIHVSNYSEIIQGADEPLGTPDTETKVSQAVVLYPGDEATLSITDSFSKLQTEAEAHRDAIEAGAKLRLGSISNPVGAELMTQVTRELSQTRTDQEGHTQDVATSVVVRNNTDEPFRVHLAAWRRIQRVRQECMVVGNLDYAVQWTPWQPGYAQRVEGVQSAYWATKAQFYSSMAGQEPANVGRYGGKRARSLSDAARGLPQGQPPARTFRFPYVVEFPRQIAGDVDQVREPLESSGPSVIST